MPSQFGYILAINELKFYCYKCQDMNKIMVPLEQKEKKIIWLDIYGEKQFP
jgi:hypothetical protein